MFFWAAIVGAFGVLARILTNQMIVSPFSTLVVNVAGSFLIGVFYALFRLGNLSEGVFVVLAAGFLGGLTTFSGFALESLKLLQEGRWGAALANVTANNLLSLAFCYLGVTLVTVFRK